METEPHRRPEIDIEVEISDNQSHLAVDRVALAALVRLTLGAEGVEGGSISVALVDDPTIRAINARHLAHDWPTDVISFLLSDPDDREIQGELVVSAEMARSTAAEVGADAPAELSLYVVHGLLHLCGHDDTNPEAAAAMRRREGEILALAGLTNTYDLVAIAAKTEREKNAWPL